MYTVGAVAPVGAGAAAAPADIQQGVGGSADALPLFANASRHIGKVITVNGAGAPFTYNVQFGPVGAEGAALAAAATTALQILNIPEADLKKITILNDVVVAGVGGSRKKRQSKKKNNNKHNNKNNQ